MESNTSNKKIWIVIGVIVAVIAASAIAFFVGRGMNQAQTGDSSNQGTTSAAPSEAQEGEAQDEAKWGESTVDRQGRNIRTPLTGVGIPLGTVTKNDELKCDSSEGGSVSIERTHEIQTLWTEASGPGGLTSGGLPRDYAHTAEAAMLAGWNSSAYLYRGGTESTEAISELFTGENAQKLLKELEESPAKMDSDAALRAAPDAFKVTSCSEERVVGDLAMPMSVDDEGNPDNPTWQILRVSMKWENDDWKAELEEVKQPQQDRVSNLDGWSKWQF